MIQNHLLQGRAEVHRQSKGGERYEAKSSPPGTGRGALTK
jgi:hypothetical protein